MEGGECRNWLELPQELTSSILHRLGAIEILENAQKVCRSWRHLCREPSMWQKIDMKNMEDLAILKYDLEKMCCHAIDRSQGGLIDINIEDFGSDNLLQYIADSSSNLRRLRLAVCYPITDEGLAKAFMKFSLLEELEVPDCSREGESLKVIGQSCPNLKTLKLNNLGSFRVVEFDEDALAIAENMPELRHLQLFDHRITDTGLKAILDKCLHLEYLDLRRCKNIKFAGNLEKRCSERIKVVRFPNDPTTDYPFDATVIDMDSSEDDYPDGFSDIDLVSDDEDYDDFTGYSDHSDFDDHFDDLYDRMLY